MKRVVITGIGCVTPAGLNVEATWQNLIKGKDCSDQITKFDVSLFKSQRACEVKNFNKNDYQIIKDIGDEYYSTQYACVALEEAFKDAQIGYSNEQNIPIYMGINFQEPYALKKVAMHEMKNEMKVLDEEVRYMNEPHSIVETVSKKFLLNGNHLTISAACAGGNYAITNAFDLIRYGECQFAVAGATTTLTMLGVATFSKLGILTNSLYCPFDKDRKGILFGEGSGMLVLEEYEHAIDRGVKIYAEVLGYGITCDAYHLVATEPSGTGAFIAMEKALKMADLSFNQIDYVSAHGTGTIANDSAEVKAIHQVFGENLMETPCSSIKSMIGHSLATSSAMEAVICCKVLENNILPPTINFQTPDPECDIDCVPNDSREKKVNIVMNNSFGFGGYNCITILKKI